jgi:hypothetical protein
MWLISAPSSLTPGLDLGPIQVRRIMEMEQIFLRVLRLSSHQYNSTNVPHTHTHTHTHPLPLLSGGQSEQNLGALKQSSFGYQEAMDTQRQQCPVSTGNTFQDLPRLRETADNTERYI